MNNKNIQNLVQKTSAFNGAGFDTSCITGDWMLVLEVQALTGNARFEFQDTVDAFIDERVIATVSVTGSLTKGAVQRFSFRKNVLPFAQLGNASSEVRLSLTDLSSFGGDTVTYQGYIEY